jgi:tRNA(Ile2) C34 agmatinyltransferase TiaS
LASLAFVGAEAAEEYTVSCPHCGRDFTASPLVEPSGRAGGFKCPHCRLFVPYERADEASLTGTAD